MNITQNVSDLLERANCSNIIHVHGELTKIRSSNGMNNPNYVNKLPIIDIRYNELKIGDVDDNGSQYRPHVCWFGETPFRIDECLCHLLEADTLVIIGTSLEISYTIDLLKISKRYKVYYIDPNPSNILDEYLDIEYIYMRM